MEVVERGVAVAAAQARTRANLGGFVRRNDGGVETCERLVGPNAPQKGRGLLLSRHGVCDTSEDACRKRSFPSDTEAARGAFLPDIGH